MVPNRATHQNGNHLKGKGQEYYEYEDSVGWYNSENNGSNNFGIFSKLYQN